MNRGSAVRRRPPSRVVRAEPTGEVVRIGVLKGRRVASLTGYQLEDLRDWTAAQLTQYRKANAGSENDFVRELEAQAKAVQDERERRWAELTT